MTGAINENKPYEARIDDLPTYLRPSHRQRCSQSSHVAHLGKVHCKNGTVQYKAVCPECGGRGGPIPHGDIAGLDEHAIPFITVHEITACERCGSTDGSEVHHWAPRHLFDDAHEWPTSRLCRLCHAKWHSIVTPTMHLRKSA